MSEWTPEQWSQFFSSLGRFIADAAGLILAIVGVTKASRAEGATKAIKERVESQSENLRQTKDQVFRLAKDAQPGGRSE